MQYKDRKKIVQNALAEDIQKGDVTTKLTIPAAKSVKAQIIVKEDSVLAGVALARIAFKSVNSRIKVKNYYQDKDQLKAGAKVLSLTGPAASILTAERVALNFISHMSGIASYTYKFVNRIKGTKARIRDTRKTTPNLRALEKEAVVAGGGVNHRLNLNDGIIVKDNHLKAMGIVNGRYVDELELDKLIKKLNSKTKLAVEIEVENIPEFKKVIAHRPDIILLDNFNVLQIKKAVDFRNQHYPRVQLEASGGIRLGNVARIAATGVDYISIGAITHSPRAIDFSLEIIDG
jgi:nicotinate-nucleotide pyrophosphorylase (carboxylating)